MSARDCLRRRGAAAWESGRRARRPSAPGERGGRRARHVAYGVTDRHYDSVGEALLRALDEILGDAFTDDVRAPWVEAYALLAAIMRRAAGHTSGAMAAGQRSPS